MVPFRRRTFNWFVFNSLVHFNKIRLSNLPNWSAFAAIIAVVCLLLRHLHEIQFTSLKRKAGLYSTPTSPRT